jgi:UDP-N-acetylmuramyl-tripeptide synthetase
MSEPRTIASLLAEVDGARLQRGDPRTAVDAIDHDSRQVRPGALFLAIPGFNVDGHDFVAQASANGASAFVLAEGRRDALEAAPGAAAIVTVPDTRVAMSRVASWFYGHPSRAMTVIGVTGTDGKTTTSHLLTSVLEANGARVGRLGTVDVYLPGEHGKVGGRLSTPEAPEVQRLLRRMADARCEYAIVESTSHGLALHRLDDVAYDVAVCTNVTGDHLDFHQTFEAYREAKARLFELLDRAGGRPIEPAAVVNADDPSAQFMLTHTRARPLRFGVESRDAEIAARNVELRADGSSFRLAAPGGAVDVTIGLPALFNVYNALAAAGAGLACGLDLATVARGLETAPGVPGRMERVVAGQPFEVFVDYAHTGDAVRKVLEVLRAICRGRLIIVVGAAGERDPGRRYGVGRAAAEGADFAIFTSEDPRREDPAAIVAEIADHAERAGRARGADFIEVEDRREAIREAFRRAGPGDIVAICGKGHEQSIIYGTEERSWDDREVAREELVRLGQAPA